MVSEVKKRNVHTPAFKAKVALEAIKGLKAINEIAQAYGVHPVMVSQWKKELLEKVSILFETKRGPKKKIEDQSHHEERLYGEIGRLKMELDWLKKKSEVLI
jgi:transposase-like protein